MIIECISDLHGHYPELEGGDLLIVAGDLTARDDMVEHNDFRDWLANQDYKCKIFIGGSHDNYLTKFIPYPSGVNFRTGTYLCDSGTEFELLDIGKDGVKIVRKKLKIWGSPWTKTFPGMNPNCKAFTVDTENELMRKFKIIPPDIDILITHSPCYGVLDRTIHGINAGSGYLSNWFKYVGRPKLHVFGHIHEGYGMKSSNLGFVDLNDYTIFVNASHVNEHYEPVNKSIRIIL